jgi:hypothetical protein
MSASSSGQVGKIPSSLETTGQSIILSFVQNFKGVCLTLRRLFPPLVTVAFADSNLGHADFTDSNRLGIAPCSNRLIQWIVKLKI